ncbi:MAG: NAD(P)/FAD-dependent oxidoreductase [Sandaracinus sp.]
MTKTYDVIVIGGGPAGSTVANLLSQKSVSVLLLEKDHFPRFHIGESLLPCDLPIFERLGVDPGAAGFLFKAGAEFLDERVGGRCLYEFSDALPGTPSHAYQVERAVFDHWLLERAKAVGVEVRTGERVIEAITPDRGGAPGEVLVRTTATHASERERIPDASYRARYVIDATGQDAVLGRRDKTTRMLEDFGLGAAFTHWEELSPEIDHELCVRDRGTIKVLFVDDGWCWAIPLGNRKISIGLVSRRRGIKPEWLEQTIAASPFLSRVTASGRQVRRPNVLASWSFHNKKQHGARWTCTGDSACFIDPVFSSGVSLGMVGAAHVADTLLEAFAKNDEARPDLMDAHALHMMHAYNTFATLVNSWYHTSLLHTLFFSPEPNLEWKRGLTSILAGDVWRDDNVFQAMLLSSKRRRKELVPELVAPAE